MAQEHENNLRYKDALAEYENFKILSTEHTERVDESIKKLKLILYPERFIIARLVEKIEEFSSHSQFEEAAQLCERMIVLAALNSQEFQWASKKKQEMRYMAFRSKESKK